jgi:hypothetical protein
MTKELTKPQKDLLARIIAALENLGCTYTVTSPGGDTVTNTQSLRKRAPSLFPRGEVRQYYRPFVENLQVGQSAEVPFDKYRPEGLQSGLVSYCAELWGRGSATTSLNPEKGVIEFLRTDGI